MSKQRTDFWRYVAYALSIPVLLMAIFVICVIMG